MQTEVLGIKTEYETNGITNGNAAGITAPVLILHGWGANAQAVRPIANCIARLGFETVSVDFPGFGGTEEPPEAWGVPEYAAFTREFIRARGLEGCHVVCHSFGGRVAIQLASGEPKLFGKLVFVDAAGVRSKRGIRYYLKTWKYKLGKRLAAIPALNRAFRLEEKRARAGSADYRALQSDVMRQTLVKVVNLDLTNKLPLIQNETLLVWGDKDEATPLWMARVMEKNIKNSGLAILEGAGHYSYADNYPQFCAVMKAYFAQQGEV